MKSSIVGLVLLCTLNADASTKMNSDHITVVNDIVNAVKNTPEAALFAKNVRFDEITYDFSADRKDAIIEAKGLLLFEGDIACGMLGLKIERKFVLGFGFGYAPQYTATLDKSGLAHANYCQLKE